jgi:hypothetical protein
MSPSSMVERMTESDRSKSFANLRNSRYPSASFMLLTLFVARAGERPVSVRPLPVPPIRAAAAPTDAICACVRLSAVA